MVIDLIAHLFMLLILLSLLSVLAAYHPRARDGRKTGLGGYLLRHPTSVKKLMAFSQDMKRAAQVSTAVTTLVLEALT